MEAVQSELEREEQLLYSGEDGDEEETLSDDSLRLRLSDDEDAEQDSTNDINIVEFKLEEQSTTAVTAEKESYSNLAQVVEEITTSGIEELKQEKNNTDADVCERKNIADNISNCSRNSQKNSTETNDIERNFLCDMNNSRTLSNMKETYTGANDKIKSKCNKEIFTIINNIGSGSLLTYVNHDENIVEVEVLNHKLKTEDSEVKCISKSDGDLKITEASNPSLTATLEKHILENDNSFANSCIKPSSCQSGDLTIHNKDYSKGMISGSNEKSVINNCTINTLNDIDSSNFSIAPITTEICNTEKSPIVTPFLKNNNNSDNNSTMLNDKLIDKIIISDIQHEKHSDKITHKQQSTNASKCDNLEGCSSFCEDVIKHKDIQHENVIENENLPEKETTQQKTLLQNQNDITNIKDRTKVISESNDENVDQIIGNDSLSTKCILLSSINVENINDENKDKNAGTIIQRRKRSQNVINTIQDYAVEEDKQEEGKRQKRKTAKDAEEIIRKEYLNNDSDSNDATDRNVYFSSASTLKRNYEDNKDVLFNSGVIKKVKMNTKSEEKDVAKNISNLSYIEKFFQRDVKKKLSKLTQEELEELLIQKIVEAITMRSEIGQLREQARASEKNYEITRARLQHLAKQIKDFEMVLSRNAIDRRANPDKFVAPIKINRSVGLQVNFLSEHGMQNLRQIQQSSELNIAKNITSSVCETNNITTNSNSNSKRGIKIRSPRRCETYTVVPTTTISQSPIQVAPLISTVTPAALVVAKPLESQRTLTLPSQPVQQLLSAQQQQVQAQSHQAIVLNGKLQNQISRQAPTLIPSKPTNNDLIDLTDEEDKSKPNVKVTTVTTNSAFEQQLNATTQPAQCFQRVIQTLPANVAIATQPTSIKVVQPNQTTPAAFVNNLSTPRLAYVMPGGIATTTRQLLITSNANQVRPVLPSTTCSRSAFPAVTYKTGISTVANGTVRVLTTAAIPAIPAIPAISAIPAIPAIPNIQINKHPAPLPDTPSYTATPGRKLPPPTPSLKITKVPTGIVLSWNMILSDQYADIASYQLYAYQEVAGTNPSTKLWKKVGDVRALPLPMACTLTQFSEGNNYYFAVRAVDTYSRKGQYSIPGNISL